MVDGNKTKQVAEFLLKARQQVQACPPVSAEFGITDIQEAYAIQEYNTQQALKQGRRLSGRKIGLTSVAVQKQLGVDQPDFGMLFTDMEYMDGANIQASGLIAPKVEGEIAFVLGRDIERADISLAELIRSVDYVLPALEIVDSAIENWNITITDTIADNASAAAYVLGKTPVSLDALDLALEGMVLRKNHQIASIGVGAACLDHPLYACMWLARTMIEVGRPLQAGDVLLSGALGPMVAVAQGDSIQLDLTHLGQVSCQFV
ncbi:fumarylacetoacetate hydrolase family protein [Advenella alkanexedens]|uniref:Fumarylacetoacetate hydrolase family protein n=1 Tax=Advenella alkanexedens TaxID=1481665 RepID=A0ABS6NMJ8_9BURK|nr:fumarylacetoacetate hydrolase family protein [Advenella alkanexedens]MBV4396589.1 fumarylacetoacetate hydrolase family protein [Advenella alkanexedens]